MRLVDGGKDFDAVGYSRFHSSTNPDDWKIAFADLPGYREWLSTRRGVSTRNDSPADRCDAIIALRDEIEIVGAERWP